jgi:CspA family cold shock protein
MEQGTIKRITDKGFGFISPKDSDNDNDMFFHSSCVDGVHFNDLREGQEVTYTIGQGPKGPRAENVRPGDE